MGEIKLDGYVCERCEHTWVSRANSVQKPLVCPRCKSPYWDTPRKNKKKEDKRSVRVIAKKRNGDE